MTNSPFAIISCHFRALSCREDSVCAWLPINPEWYSAPSGIVIYILTETLLTNETACIAWGVGVVLVLSVQTSFYAAHYAYSIFQQCPANIQCNDKKHTQTQAWKNSTTPMERGNGNAEYGNQMCLQITSNSSTRAFNEITSLNEHWERVKSEQWLFRVVWIFNCLSGRILDKAWLEINWKSLLNASTDRHTKGDRQDIHKKK